MPRSAHIQCELFFEASHRIQRDDWSQERNQQLFGRCNRLHGHSYRLRVALHGPIDPDSGMVMNFTDLKRILRARVLDRLDHSHLNDHLGDLSTAENLLWWIVEQLRGHLDLSLVHRLELWETRTACAYLTQEDLRDYL
ncbi:MAG TPA: 6-carboxytetrahydropterin synthase [Armatimonadota bacterium]|jgi:6-pyruvoyltetrahydropterin/6-carboxytetrahydropterin synthase